MIQERSEQIALAYERNVLTFAIMFKTRRVYVTRWTSTVLRNDETCLRLDWNYKLFSFENRDEAYNNKCENWCIERSVNQNESRL